MDHGAREAGREESGDAESRKHAAQGRRLADVPEHAGSGCVCVCAGGGVVWSPVEKRWFARKCGAGAKSRHKRDELDHWGQLGHWS